MIKLTDLFEDITVSPKRMVIFKVPVDLSAYASGEARRAHIEYSDGVSIAPRGLLPDLNLYANHPILKFAEVPVEIEEDTDKFDDVRCISCIAGFNYDLYEDLPDGFSFDPTAYDQTGFCYVSFKNAGNIRLDDVEELVTIELSAVDTFKTVQDAANYLLFKSS